MSMPTLAILGLFCSALSVIARNEPDLKNGPSGFQTFKGVKSAKTIKFTNEDGSKVETGNGGASGKSSNLNVDSEKLKGDVKGDIATGTRNGKVATGQEVSKDSFKANGEGKTATADVNGDKLTAAKAGQKHISGAHNKGSKSVNAKNEKGGETWDANLAGKLGTAKDNESGKKATLTGIVKNTRKVKGVAGNGKIDAGRNKANARTKYGYGTVHKKNFLGGQSKTRYTAQQKSKGRTSHHTRIVKGKRTQLYESSVNNKNEVGVHSSQGRKLATVKVIQYTDVPCENLKNNMWAKGSKDFVFHDKTMKIVYPEKEGGYTFPSCMDVSVDVTLPKGVRVKDLAGALTVILPGCGEFVCGTGTECLSHQCFYKSLCPDDAAKPSQKHKDAGNYIMSQTDHNACQDNFPSGGKVTLKFHYCPDVNADISQTEACRTTLTSAVAVASMQVQIDVWTVKKRPMGCNIDLPKDAQNVKKLGCKRVLCSYRVKWLNIPDIGGVGTSAGKILDKTNCNLGKRPCVGHDKLDVLGILSGKGLGGIFGG